MSTTYIHRRSFVGAAFFSPSLGRALRGLCVFALVASGLVHAQAWPTKPVRIVVPFAPGGTTDLIARVVGQTLSQTLGQPFVVDSKPGASGAIGAVEVARAPADGYTLLLATPSTHAIAPAVSTHLPYNAVEDFTPIALLAEASNLLLVSPTIEAKNLKELLALAREKPGYLNYTSGGIGSFSHLAFELLSIQAGVSMTHIPYKGTGATITDLISGAVHMSWDALPSGLPHVKAGRVRALAVSGPRRSPLAPEIPTVAEAGLPGFSVLTWFGLYGPRGMSPQLAQRINEEVNKVLQSPEMAARFATLGIEPARGSAADFAKMVASDTVRWGRVAKELRLKVD